MLFDRSGNRKYLTGDERRAFIKAAARQDARTEAFCLTLAYTGARISEVTALTPARIDLANGVVVIETLKRRQRGVYRAVPIPGHLLDRLASLVGDAPAPPDSLIFPWCRTTAWRRVKDVMEAAGIPPLLTKPRALRHAFGVQGLTEAMVPINMMQKWLGHARIETTAIYANAVGAEERKIAQRMWE